VSLKKEFRFLLLLYCIIVGVFEIDKHG